MDTKIAGKVYVLGDNIDTDQMLTAEYMKLNPEDPEDYKTLGSLAMCGLPDGYPPFVDPDTGRSPYVAIVARDNFGCGSSREHAPKALGASGVRAVVARSYARIFFRNCISTGELVPVEVREDLTQQVETGDEIEIDLDANSIRLPGKGIEIATIPLGEVSRIIEAGGLLGFAKQEGIVA